MTPPAVQHPPAPADGRRGSLEPHPGACALRVCIAAHVFPRTADDAMAPFMGSFAAALADHGAKVDVVCPHARGLAAHEQRGGVSIHRFRYGPAFAETLAYHGDMHERARTLEGVLLLPWFLLAYAAAVLRHARGADVIHAHWWIPGGLVCTAAAALLRKPLVITLHGTDVYLVGRSRWRRALGRWVFGRAARVVANSERTAQEAISAGLASRSAMVVGGLGVDVAAFHPDGRQTGGAGRILFAGRLVARKGVDVLLRALPHVLGEFPEARLRVVGSGPEQGRLEALVQDIGLAAHVDLLPAAPQAALAEHYRWADMLVVPSVVVDGIHEGLGVVILEAMACGTPVIGTRNGGIPEIVRDGVTGLLVAERDPEELAGAICRLLRAPERTRAMGRAAAEEVAGSRSWQAVGAEALSIYRAALQR